MFRESRCRNSEVPHDKRDAEGEPDLDQYDLGFCQALVIAPELLPHEARPRQNSDKRSGKSTKTDTTIFDNGGSSDISVKHMLAREIH